MARTIGATSETKNSYWLTKEQLEVIKPYFPRARGKDRVDDLRVICWIIFVLKRGLQWRDAPPEYGIPKTLYNRFIRWSKMGIFDNTFTDLSSQNGKPEQLQIDATYIKNHRTASSLALVPSW